MACRSERDDLVPGLKPVMHDLRVAAAKEPPRERDEVPETLLDIARALGEDVRIDVYTNRHLPESAILQGGDRYQAAATADRLVKRVTDLAAEVPTLRLGQRIGVSEEKAVQERLHVLRTDLGVPVFVGAVLHVGIRQEVIAAVSRPADVDHVLANGLWRLHAKKQGRLRVGFICAAGAFCPRVEQKPRRPGGGDWADETLAALNEVYNPFDEIRLEMMTELQEGGIQPLAVIANQPIPEHVRVLALAVPTQPINSETLAWMLQARQAGAGLILLLPGARMVASNGRLSEIETGHAGLLAALGIRRTDALLADRASLAKFKAPDRGGSVGDLLPLVAEVARTAPFHGTVTGLFDLSLPFASALEATGAGPLPLAWSRPGVSPVSLPAGAANAALDSAAPPQPRGDERIIAMAIDEPNLGRAAVVGSSLAYVSMSAPELLKSFDWAGLAKSGGEFQGRLASFASAARSYRSTHRGNRALRGSTLRFFEQMAYWAAEPESVQELKSGRE